MKRSIQEFKDMYKDQDIWIIAKGASLNYVNPSFFDGKITIGINDSVLWYNRPTFNIRKEFHPDESVIDSFQKISKNTKLVLSEYQGCVFEWGKNEDHLKDLLEENDIWFFKTPFTHGELVMPDPNIGEELPASLSSTAMAMYFAGFLGAKNIILCGNDEGKLDGEDYVKEVLPYVCNSDHTHILNWQASQSIIVRNILRDIGLNIYSLHPFINLFLEGHKIL